MLRSKGYDHSQVSRLLEELCYYPSLVPFTEIEQAALEIYRDTALDFEDCILLACNKLQGYRIGTFDKEIIKLAA